MRNQFWDFVVNTKYFELFATKYRCRVRRIQLLINGISTLITLVCITGWSLDANLSLLWGILLALAQAIPHIAQFFPYFAHLCALSYFIQDAKSFAMDAENAWNCHSESDEATLKDILYDLRRRYSQIDMKYIGDLDIPAWESIRTDAWAECQQYFKSFTESAKEESHHA